jgi:hypothetical protein
LDEIEKNLVLNKKTKVLFHTLVVLIIFNIFFVGVPSNLIKSINYRNWFGAFTQFEADQVKAIAKANDTVYLNAKNTIDNWEVTYEIPMHINYFYGAKPSISMFEENMPLSGYLFTRSSIEPVMGNDTASISKYPIVDAGEYNIYQIDSVEFNKLFKFRPIEALQNPPMSDKKITYFWEIRKIK